MSGPMWYCPKCETWVGAKLDECSEGHSRPWRPVLNEDPKKPAWEVTFLDRIRAKLSADAAEEDSQTVMIDGVEWPVHQIDEHDGRVILSVDVTTAVEQGFDFSSIWLHKQVDVSMEDREFQAEIDMCSVEHGFAAIGLTPIEQQEEHGHGEITT